jgi:hypothetical protein
MGDDMIPRRGVTGYGVGYLTEGVILDTVYGVVTEGRCSDTETGYDGVWCGILDRGCDT